MLTAFALIRPLRPERATGVPALIRIVVWL